MHVFVSALVQLHERRLCVNAYAGQLPVKSCNADGRGVCDVALLKPGGTKIDSQHIWVAVHVDPSVFQNLGIEPGSGGKADAILS